MAALTRTIDGHEITLTAGRRYLASRPMASKGVEWFDVTIRDITDGRDFDRHAAAIIGPLDYEAANRLLAAFNDGEMSFDGRVWV